MVCRSYGVKEEDLLFSKRGMRNEASNAAIYLLRQLRGSKLEEIGREFGLGNYSTVRTIIERARKDMAKNRNSINALSN
jgi:chromosomal replication initiation ATPase DnaA